MTLLPVSRTHWVTWNVLPVSRGTVQLMGSGDRIINCSGDLTRVGSGGDYRSNSFAEMSLKFVSHLDHWLLEVVDVVLDG